MTIGNLGWHTEADFEAQTRWLVGEASTDDMTSAQWQQCRSWAENRIMAYLPEGDRKYRTMLDRVPGEYAPQDGPLLEDGEYIHTVSLPEIVSSPPAKLPRVWRNLEGPWEHRFSKRRTSLLVPQDDYTVSSGTITFKNHVAREGDRFIIEYWHNLTPKPAFLRDLSILGTSYRYVLKTHGISSNELKQWLEQYGGPFWGDLKQIKEGKICIPEFDAPNLYLDWDETGGVSNILLQRA